MTSMKIVDIIKSPAITYKFFLKFVDEVDALNEYKDSLTADELAHNYTIINKRFLKLRDQIQLLILNDDKLYILHKDFAAKNLIYDILLDGYSYDINKTSDGDPLMAFIPYRDQVPLFLGIQNNEKNIHVEKGRRQGASKGFILAMKWFLVHGKKEVMYTTHKDLDSLDKIKGDSGHNSTFDNVRWLLDKSIWVDKDWRNGADGGYTQQKQINLNGNVLLGAVLGKGTAVGMAGTRIFVDEIDVVCDMYPNQAQSIVGSFSMSVTHIYLYSTYRSMMYPFYRFKVENLEGWSFYTLDWRNNPTCNKDWYNKAKAKMGNDAILTARELDRDPTKVRQGTVFSEEMSEFNYYTILPENKYIKVIGGDFGGGASLTSFVLGYFDTKSGKLYLDDLVESTKLDQYGVSAQLEAKGFKDVVVYADQSAFSQVGARGHDWNTLLKSVGVKLRAVNNHSIYLTHALMRQAIRDGLLLINKSNNTLLQKFLSYSYKEDNVFKDVNSHFGDACTYLFKGLFQKVERGII